MLQGLAVSTRTAVHPIHHNQSITSPCRPTPRLSPPHRSSLGISSQVMSVLSSPVLSSGVILRDLRVNCLSEHQSSLESPIYQALGFLQKELQLIVHGSSMPSNGEFDTGIGSPYSNAAKDCILFIKNQGVSALQLGPEGLLKNTDISPYLSSIFSQNTLFLDIETLTSDRREALLSYDQLQALVQKHPASNTPEADYKRASSLVTDVIKQAYENFQTQAAKGTPSQLQTAFKAFAADNQHWLDTDAVYEVLQQEHNNDDYNQWPSELDQQLIHWHHEDSDRGTAARTRLSQLQDTHHNAINEFIFGQFLVDLDRQELREFATEHEIKLIGDALVGNSPRDVWANQEAFLPNTFVGVPGQAWGIQLLNPENLFHHDDLGSAGQLLEKKFARLFEYYDGVRIDHIFGLYDPFTYQDTHSTHQEDTYQDTQDQGTTEPINIQRLSERSPHSAHAFKRIIPDLLMPMMHKNGVNPKDNVCEDLGDAPAGFYDDFNRWNLPGIKQLLWGTRGENGQENQTALVGSHDNMPLVHMISNDHFCPKNDDYLNYLSGYLNADPHKKQRRQDMRGQLTHHQPSYFNAKFQELLTCPPQKIQVNFMDFFGMKETYNTGKPETSWRLRLPTDYKDRYLANIRIQKECTFQLRSLLTQAIQSRVGLEIARAPHHERDHKRQELESRTTPIMQSLRAEQVNL